MIFLTTVSVFRETQDHIIFLALHFRICFHTRPASLLQFNMSMSNSIGTTVLEIFVRGTEEVDYDDDGLPRFRMIPLPAIKSPCAMLDLNAINSSYFSCFWFTWQQYSNKAFIIHLSTILKKIWKIISPDWKIDSVKSY